MKKCCDPINVGNLALLGLLLKKGIGNITRNRDGT